MLYNIVGQTDDTNCLSCPTGYHSDSGTAGPSTTSVDTEICYCDQGYGREVDLSETSNCSACAIGKYSDSHDNSACKDCPSGRYQGSTTQAACTPCGVGKWMHTDYTAQVEDTQCVDCYAVNFTSNEGTSGTSNTDSLFLQCGLLLCGQHRHMFSMPWWQIQRLKW